MRPELYDVSLKAGITQTALVHTAKEGCTQPYLDTSDVVLAAKHVDCAYRKRSGFLRSVEKVVLQDVSFALHKGEVLGIVGANGAGKSTLLRVLAGVLAPAKGSVEKFNYSSALLSLQGGLLPYLSGYDNALLMGVSLGISKREMQKRLSDVHKYSGLGDAFYDHVREYSSGMRARLCFSVAVQIETDILLIDEMLSVGDAVFREQSLSTIQERIWSGCATVLVSHNIQLIQRICTSVIRIADGTISEKIHVEQGQACRQKLVQMSR